MKNAFIWTICFLILLSSGVSQADSLKLNGSSLGQLNQRAAVSFLPVEEAYQLYPRRHGDLLYLDWVIAPGYYLYQEQFASTLLDDNRAEITLEQSFTAGIVKYDDYYDKDVEIYYTETRVQIPVSATTQQGYVRVGSQGCADAGLCYPPRILYVDLGSSASVLPVLDQLPENFSTPPAPESTPFILILGFALLGGLILNLMPCVFPVLSIKVLSLSQHHLSSHGRHIHGLVYSLGVIVSFLIIAIGLITLRAGGEALGWGFQLQSPGFITVLVYLFFIMGLSFSGFFEAGTRLMNLGQGSMTGNDLHHSFLAGVLATIVASPCTAPFMGTALGFALTQETYISLLVFTFLGLGMALPFLILTWVPSLLNRIPKPGPWMETLKGFLAFPLYLTAIWLLWILGNQTGPNVTAIVLCSLTFLALAIWLGKHRSRTAKTAALAVLLLAIFLPVDALYSKNENAIWQPYTPQRLETLLAAQQPVFINLTADWCITCLANEKVALDTDSFRATLLEQNIVYLKGDWTNKNEDISQLLNENGRSGVPLYLFYPAGQRTPVVLPQILSPALVNNTLKGS